MKYFIWIFNINPMPFLSILSAIAALGAGIIIGRYACPKSPVLPDVVNLDEHEQGIAPLSMGHKLSGRATVTGPKPRPFSGAGPTISKEGPTTKKVTGKKAGKKK